MDLYGRSQQDREGEKVEVECLKRSAQKEVLHALGQLMVMQVEQKNTRTCNA